LSNERSLRVVLGLREIDSESLFSPKDTLKKSRSGTIYGQERTPSDEAVIFHRVKIHIMLLLGSEPE
jgi:hypothetical protein